MRKLILLISLVALSASSAYADALLVEDPASDSGAIDVELASHSHEEVAVPDGTAEVLMHELFTTSGWTAEDLDFIRFQFTSRRWEQPRLLWVRPNDEGGFAASIWSGGRLRGFADVARPDDRTLRVGFPKRLLGKRFSSYRWSMVADENFVCDAPPPDECEPLPADRVPDQGSVLHRGL